MAAWPQVMLFASTVAGILGLSSVHARYSEASLQLVLFSRAVARK
jgi:hypothetical protein